MNKKVLVTVIVVIVTFSASAVWLFWPSTYEDCVLENTEKVSNEYAAESIILACTKLFADENYDYKKAKKAGYSDTEIAEYLSQEKKYAKCVLKDIHGIRYKAVIKEFSRNCRKKFPFQGLSFDEYYRPKISELSDEELFRIAGIKQPSTPSTDISTLSDEELFSIATQIMNIQEFRAKFPEYDDLTDEELSEKLHKKYFSYLPYKDFYEGFVILDEEKPRKFIPYEGEVILDTPTDE